MTLGINGDAISEKRDETPKMTNESEAPPKLRANIWVVVLGGWVSMYGSNVQMLLSMEAYREQARQSTR